MSNKYLEDEQAAIENGAHQLVRIFNLVKEIALAIDEADLGAEIKLSASKRLQKLVGDVWSSVPNQYKPVVQDLIHSALFPAEAETSPLLTPTEEEKTV